MLYPVLLTENQIILSYSQFQFFLVWDWLFEDLLKLSTYTIQVPYRHALW